MGRVYKSQNKILLDEMLKIYGPLKYDWMNFLITSRNTLTIHHIYEKCLNGGSDIGNAALVTKKGHRLLNMLESRSLILLEEWNCLFLEINKCMKPVDEYYLDKSEELKRCTLELIYKKR